MGTPFIGAAIAFLASFALAFPARRLALRLGVVDRPNDRSSHRVPTARGGGVVVVLGAALALLALVPPGHWSATAALAVVAVALVSLRDDLGSLPFTVRLAVQALAAIVVVVGLDLPATAVDLPGAALSLPRGLGMALAIGFVVAYCNFFNFMDGINGLAAGQALLSGVALAALLWQGGCGTAATVAAAVAGASAGFLPHNYPSARIFMGDVGSVTLGFVLASLSLYAHARGGVSLVAVLLVHTVFLVDAVITVLKRAGRGENIAKPHREHAYQYLVRRGWSHAGTSLAFWLLTAWCGAWAVVYARSGPGARWAVLLAAVAPPLAMIAAMHGNPPGHRVEPGPVGLADPPRGDLG